MMKADRVAAMSKNLWLIMGLVSVTTLGGMTIQVPSSQAVTATTKFVCDTYEGKPATVARTKKGNVPIVVWNSEDFSQSGFTPQVRCKQVSARFQSMYRNGQLKYITAGTLNNLPVICATKQVNSICSKQNLLYTLKPNADPQQVIQRLMMVRSRASSRAIEESVSAPDKITSTSIDLNWLEETAEGDNK